MLNKTLYPVVWIAIIAASFALGLLSANSIFASAGPAARPVRSELPESSAASISFDLTGGLPLEPRETLRGGLADAYAEQKRTETMPAHNARPAIHSEDRIEQLLSHMESSELVSSVPSELPSARRGGLAENHAADTRAPLVSKPIYAPHSDDWTNVQLDRFAATEAVSPGIPDRPTKVRGGPFGD